MKIKMCDSFLTSLNLLIFLAVLTIGGVNTSFAAERFIFEVTAVNNTSKITTVFQVFAENERNARENVAGNGWSILSIRQVSYKQTKAVPVQIGDAPTKYIVITSPLGDSGKKPDKLTDNGTFMSDDELINSILAMHAPNVSPMQGDVDILAMTPDSKQLELVHVVYFDLGIVAPNLKDADRAWLSRADRARKYYLFGHTDDVAVGENAAYKDNFELSFKRAEAIKEILIQNGINPANINTVGLGALYPAVKNYDSAGGTVKNRRVEIYGLRKTE